MQIEQPWLWRRPGWWSLKVNVAGADLGSASEGASDSELVPVATTAEVLQLLEVVTGDVTTTDEVRSLVTGTPNGFVGQPPRARWLHPFAHRRIGYLAGQRAVLTRAGWLDHTLQVVPYGRIQSITVSQGPISRRVDLANANRADLYLSIHVNSSSSPVVLATRARCNLTQTAPGWVTTAWPRRLLVVPMLASTYSPRRRSTASRRRWR